MTPGPWRITFVTNPDDCNLHCVMCDGNSELARLRDGPRAAPRRMPVALVRRILDEQRDGALREIIPSTMGEPLLYPDLDALVDLCAERGVRLNLTTNGTFPGRGAAAWAASLCPVSSDVKISWNGATAATAESVMRGLSFERAREDVRSFVAGRDRIAAAGGNRCRVSFQVTAMEANVAELPAIVRLAATLGVDRVKANQLWIHFDALEPLSLRRSRESLHRWNAAVRASRAAAEEARLPSGAAVLLQNFVELAEEGEPAPRGECPFLGREAWVTVDGRFAPCPAPGAARGRLGSFGSLSDRPLGEIWDGEPFRSFLERWPAHPACSACDMRRPGGA
jgi:MoaA/NifB/PqqE/SkfB family radical SAM enzyme